MSTAEEPLFDEVQSVSQPRQAALARSMAGSVCCIARGRSSVVERQLPKLYVVGSIPIARSKSRRRRGGVRRFFRGWMGPWAPSASLQGSDAHLQNLKGGVVIVAWFLHQFGGGRGFASPRSRSVGCPAKNPGRGMMNGRLCWALALAGSLQLASAACAEELQEAVAPADGSYTLQTVALAPISHRIGGTTAAQWRRSGETKSGELAPRLPMHLSQYPL